MAKNGRKRNSGRKGARIEEQVRRLAKAQATAKAGDKTSRSLAIARGGLRTGFDTINMLTATITDTLEESITTGQANVVVSAVRQVLKVVELQFKYGKPRPNGARDRDLQLVDSTVNQAIQ